MKRFLFLLVALLALFGYDARAVEYDTVWVAQDTYFDTNAELFHPTDTSIFILHANNFTQIRSVQTGAFISQFNHPYAPFAKFSKNAKYLGMSDGINNFCLYDGATFDSITTFPIKGNDLGGLNINFSTDETKLAIGGLGGVSIYQLPSGELLQTIYVGDTSKDYIESVNFSRDDNELAYFTVAWGRHTYLQFIDLTTYQKESASIMAGDGSHSSCDYSHDGKYIVTSRKANYNTDTEQDSSWYYILDAKTKQRVSNLEPPKNMLYLQSFVRFTNDDKYVFAGGGYDYNVYFINFLNATPVKTITTNTYTNVELDLSTNYKYILSGYIPYIAMYNSTIPITSVEENLLTNFTISPNPATNTLSLSFSLSVYPANLNISIYNELGVLVKTLYSSYWESSLFSRTFEISDLASGAYILTVSGNNLSYSSTFIISR